MRNDIRKGTVRSLLTIHSDQCSSLLGRNPLFFTQMGSRKAFSANSYSPRSHLHSTRYLHPIVHMT